MVRTAEELCVLVLAVLPFASPFTAFSHESRELDESWHFAGTSNPWGLVVIYLFIVIFH